MLVSRSPPPGNPEVEHIDNVVLEGLSEIAMNFRASYFTIVAGFVIYVYDICLTLEDERALLWSKGGRFIKSLYLANRYIPFVGLLLVVYANNPIRPSFLTDDMCKGTFILVQTCQSIEIMAATSIFVIRIHTVYSGNRFAQRLLVSVMIASHISITIFTIMICYDLRQTMSFSKEILFCVGTPPAITGAMYIAPIVIESFVLFMTLFHAIQFTRTGIGLNKTPAGSILRTLYVDGSWYYLIVFSLRLATILVFYFATESLILLMPYLEYALTSTVTSRWFLSFRKVIIEAFSSRPALSLGTGQVYTETGADIAFERTGHRSRSGGKLDLFISSFVTRPDHSRQNDDPPVVLGFDSSTDHELQFLDPLPPLQNRE